MISIAVQYSGVADLLSIKMKQSPSTRLCRVPDFFSNRPDSEKSAFEESNGLGEHLFRSDFGTSLHKTYTPPKK